MNCIDTYQLKVCARLKTLLTESSVYNYGVYERFFRIVILTYQLCRVQHLPYIYSRWLLKSSEVMLCFVNTGSLSKHTCQDMSWTWQKNPHNGLKWRNKTLNIYTIVKTQHHAVFPLNFFLFFIFLRFADLYKGERQSTPSCIVQQYKTLTSTLMNPKCPVAGTYQSSLDRQVNKFSIVPFALHMRNCRGAIQSRLCQYVTTFKNAEFRCNNPSFTLCIDLEILIQIWACSLYGK